MAAGAPHLDLRALDAELARDPFKEAVDLVATEEGAMRRCDGCGVSSFVPACCNGQWEHQHRFCEVYR